MKNLSSRQTFMTKYLLTASWIIAPIITAIIVYNKFGQIEGFYIIPFFSVPALMSYLPMKISFDDTRVVVSDLFTKTEYKFIDIKSLEYSRPTFSYHPYSQLAIKTKDAKIKEVKFMPRTTDIFGSF
jgi:hypothetical protein